MHANFVGHDTNMDLLKICNRQTVNRIKVIIPFGRQLSDIRRCDKQEKVKIILEFSTPFYVSLPLLSLSRNRKNVNSFDIFISLFRPRKILLLNTCIRKENALLIYLRQSKHNIKLNHRVNK